MFGFVGSKSTDKSAVCNDSVGWDLRLGDEEEGVGALDSLCTIWVRDALG